MEQTEKEQSNPTAEQVKTEQPTENKEIEKMNARIEILLKDLEKVKSENLEKDRVIEKYKAESEKHAKDAAWEKMAKKLPEAYRNDETRKLFETNKDEFLDKIIEIISKPVEIKATGNPIKTEEKKDSRLETMGFIII